jgi:hypothetical protein
MAVCRKSELESFTLGVQHKTGLTIFQREMFFLDTSSTCNQIDIYTKGNKYLH